MERVPDVVTGGSAGCFAADVVRAGLDPLTGRTISFNHVPMAAWAGHLCDLVLSGVLVDRDGLATAARVDTDLHPLVRHAYQQLQRSLPRAWWWMFAPQVVDINKSYRRHPGVVGRNRRVDPTTDAVGASLRRDQSCTDTTTAESAWRPRSQA